MIRDIIAHSEEFLHLKRADPRDILMQEEGFCIFHVNRD
jgi:hypothetical protein